jgi:hypothetical protein
MVRDFLHDRLQGKDFSNLTLPESRLLSTPWNLNPMENVWEYLRKNKLAITVFNDYDHIVGKSCEAWNFFADDKAAIASITSRGWAKVKP